MSLSPTFHFVYANHDFWPSFANCRWAKNSTRRTGIYQLRISYQIGYNLVITFSSFWRLSSQTSSKTKYKRKTHLMRACRTGVTVICVPPGNGCPRTHFPSDICSPKQISLPYLATLTSEIIFMFPIVIKQFPQKKRCAKGRVCVHRCNIKLNIHVAITNW